MSIHCPTIMSNQLLRIFLVCCLLAAATRIASADALEKFYGVYDGEAVSETSGILEKRDLKVTISSNETDGFVVRWIVVTHKSGGKVKRKEYTVRFRPSDRKNIYRSAMRTDVFGQDVPLDPMQGDPYFWARVEDDVLTIYALIIDEQGDYEMQTYERTLTDYGLELRYTRVSNGLVARTVTGQLKRIQ